MSHEETEPMPALAQAALEHTKKAHAQAIALDAMATCHSADKAKAAREQRVAEAQKKARKQHAAEA